MGEVQRLTRELHEAENRRRAALARLHEAGMPMRQIAGELGLSVGRVHQLIEKSRVQGD